VDEDAIFRMQSRHIHHGLMGRGSYSRSCRGRPMEEGLYRCNMKLAVTATSSTSPRAAVFHLTTVYPCRLQHQLTGNREGVQTIFASEAVRHSL